MGMRPNERLRRRTRLFCMRARENSRLLALKSAAQHLLLQSTLSSYGIFLLLSAGICVLGRLVRGTLVLSDIDFFVCCILIMASVLWIPSKHSLASAIRQSILFQWLLFHICMLPQDHIPKEEQARDQKWIALLVACAVGALTVVISPFYLLLASIAICLLLLFCAVPELLLLIVIVAFPFFNLFPHSSLVLCIALSIVCTAILLKMLYGHCVLQFGTTEALVALFTALLACGGRAGVLQAALLLSFLPLEYFFSKSVWCERAILGICFSACLCAGYGIFQYFFGGAELKWVDVSRFSDIGGRVTSVFTNPNVLAVYLLLTVPLALSAMLSSEAGWGRRVFFGLTVFLEGTCLILTWSRGAWLGALIATGLVMLFCSAKSMRVLLITGIPIAAWLPLVPRNVTNRFTSIADVRESSIRYRLFTWQGVSRLIREHPFGIGVGERAFASIYPRFAVSGTESVPHAHNLFLQITTELGLGGILCFFAILICFLVLVIAYMGRLSSTASACLIVGGFCAIIGGLVMGFFDYVWYHNGLFWFFWATLAMTVSRIRLEIEKAKGGSIALEKT